MQSRELKCFIKILTVCKNRGLGDLGTDIVQAFGPKYLEKNEIKELLYETPKNIKYADKVSFLESVNFANHCSKCENGVEKGDPAFLQGKLLYHVLCGLEACGDSAADNFYYKRWAAKTKSLTNEEEI